MERKTQVDEQQQKRIMKETFDAVSAGYDRNALRFFPASARYMVSLLGLQGHERVLDVACGTGNAALALAGALPTGQVTAVDFSAGMLEQARQKAASMKVRNVEFLERDMQELGFVDHFDVAVCAFGIFFVQDMDSQLRHIAGAIKQGGRVMIANFQESYFQPLRNMLFARLEAYGVTAPPQAWKRIATESGCRELFKKAGLPHIVVHQKNNGYYLNNAEEWWEVVWNAGFRRMVAQLAPDAQARFRREHLEEIDTLRTGEGIWLDIGVLYTIGTK